MTTLSGPREAQLLEAVDLLLDARRTGNPIQDLPPALAPTTEVEAFWIQGQLSESFGSVGGWKIGAATADATPAFAPMPMAWMAPGGSIIKGHTSRYRGLEAEVAFLLGENLPPRATPYTRNEVIAAIASCHPAIEVLESALLDPGVVSPLTKTADLQINGGFIYGPPCPEWRMVDFTQEQVVLAIDGSVRVERTGSNTAGDLLRLIPYLANEGAARTGGLRAGQWITTGSWTGNTLASAGSSVDVHFSTIGRVTTRFE